MGVKDVLAQPVKDVMALYTSGAELLTPEISLTLGHKVIVRFLGFAHSKPWVTKRVTKIRTVSRLTPAIFGTASPHFSHLLVNEAAEGPA